MGAGITREIEFDFSVCCIATTSLPCSFGVGIAGPQQPGVVHVTVIHDVVAVVVVVIDIWWEKKVKEERCKPRFVGEISGTIAFTVR